MLELDDIQHILLTRTPAITGRYEFLTFDTPAGGRAWLTELLDKVAVRGRCAATMDESRSLGRRWRSRGTACARSAYPRSPLATFPDEFREGMAARADILGDTGANALPSTGWAAWPVTMCTPSRSCSPATTSNAGDPSRSTTSCWRAPTACAVAVYLDLNATPPFNYAHDHFGFRDRLSQPVMEGSGESPHPAPARRWKPGEFILGYPDEMDLWPICRSPKSCRAQRQLHGLSAARGTRRRCSATTCARTPKPRGGGTAGSQVHGPLAQWCAAGARARTKTTPNWARIPCATTTTTIRRWTRSATRARWDRMRAGSIRATPRTT